MRTTIYINSRYLEKLTTASEILNLSKNDIISILLTRVNNKSVFKLKPYKAIEYQKSSPDIKWIIEHIDFQPVIYEKMLDFKRNYKYSVSWFVAYAIINFLDEILNEITHSENKKIVMDNYDANFIFIVKMYGKIRGFITLWGYPDKKHLVKLLN